MWWWLTFKKIKYVPPIDYISNWPKRVYIVHNESAEKEKSTLTKICLIKSWYSSKIKIIITKLKPDQQIMLCHPSDSLNLLRLISTQKQRKEIIAWRGSIYWTPPPPLTTTQYRNTSGPGPSGGQKGLRSQSQLPSARRTPHKNIRTLMLVFLLLFKNYFF